MRGSFRVRDLRQSFISSKSKGQLELPQTQLIFLRKNVRGHRRVLRRLEGHLFHRRRGRGVHGLPSSAPALLLLLEGVRVRRCSLLKSSCKFALSGGAELPLGGLELLVRLGAVEDVRRR